ncbi:CD225/dispanin family protein [Rhodococcus sp. ARC_M6]|uniref:CD225/dispanin family protein n=1 Tax=Rhodococcus sp. ARC_M6 TaxID=2928852 RepID=UPI001FB4ED89|nr:CD225/dispanin family protein [Rhodococcus sp. ARC_M6]MCJ0907100.1 CD225/dispanin family protein [Rhodococcus sp. ARC_M6]
MYSTYEPTHESAVVSADFTGQPDLPRPNVGWAVAAVVFFWPLAFSAFTHALSVYPLWASGDHAGAQRAADRTKKLGVISLVVWFVMTVAVFGAYVVLMSWILSNPSNSRRTFASFPLWLHPRIRLSFFLVYNTLLGRC